MWRHRAERLVSASLITVDAVCGPSGVQPVAVRLLSTARVTLPRLKSMRRRYAFANAARAHRNGKLRARVPETIAALAMWPTIGRPSTLGPRRPAPDPVALPSELRRLASQPRRGCACTWLSVAAASPFRISLSNRFIRLFHIFQCCLSLAKWTLSQACALGAPTWRRAALRSHGGHCLRSTSSLATRPATATRPCRRSRTPTGCRLRPRPASPRPRRRPSSLSSVASAQTGRYAARQRRCWSAAWRSRTRRWTQPAPQALRGRLAQSPRRARRQRRQRAATTRESN